jgi:hypothetical protein
MHELLTNFLRSPFFIFAPARVLVLAAARRAAAERSVARQERADGGAGAESAAEGGLICKVAADAGRSILEQYEPSFDRCARLRIVHAFRSALIAERKPGRRPKAAITAAYESWRAGLRGLALYKRHIPKFDGMSRWRRKAEQQRLMDAIHSRHRRVRRGAVYYI